MTLVMLAVERAIERDRKSSLRFSNWKSFSIACALDFPLAACPNVEKVAQKKNRSNHN